jgi:hypothetical protein
MQTHRASDINTMVDSDDITVLPQVGKHLLHRLHTLAPYQSVVALKESK